MNVLIFNPYARWTFHASYEVVAYHNLRDAGHNVDYITCNGGFSECDLHWLNVSGPRPEDACNRCINSHKNFFHSYNIAPTFITDYLSEPDKQSVQVIFDSLSSLDQLQEFHYEGINIFKCVLSSLYSHFRAGVLDFEDPSVKQLLKRYMLIGLYTAICVVRILDAKRPDAIFMFNGRMAPTRIFFELARRQGIRVVCHERALTQGYVWLFENSTCVSLNAFKMACPEKYQRPLTQGRIIRVLDWLTDKTALRADNFVTFNVANNDLTNYHLKPVLAPLANGRPPKIWALFTSSTDEINSAEDIVSPFGSQQAWIASTIDLATVLAEEVRLVIRVHPNTGSKVSKGFNQDELNFYNILSKNLPENVILLPADCGVNSYKLLESVDLCLCFVSTIGIEAAGRGIPVFYSCNCVYTSCPGVSFIGDTHSYGRLLSETLAQGYPLSPIDIKRYAFRFLDWLLFEFALNVPCVVQLSPHKNMIAASSLDELARDFSPPLDQFVDAILGLGGTEARRAEFATPSSLELETHHLELADIGQRLSEPLISILVYCRNCSATLVRCLESIRAQTFQDFEIIVLDLASTDNSAQLAEYWLSSNRTITSRVIVGGNSEMPAYTKNIGLNAAKGTFILPLDGHDLITAGYLERIKDVHLFNTQLNVIFASSLNVTSIKDGHIEGRINPASKFDWNALRKKTPTLGCHTYKKSLAIECGGYTTNFPGYEDWELLLRMSIDGAMPFECAGPGLMQIPSDSCMVSHATPEQENQGDRILSSVRSFQS